MLEAQGDDPLEEEVLAQVHDETERHIQMHLAGRNGANWRGHRCALKKM